MAEGWNHNVEYHRVVLGAMPTPCRAALDIGCGGGALLEALAPRAGRVVGVDRDAPSVEAARDRTARFGNVEVICDDVLAHPFAPGSFDLVAMVASLHHLPLEPGLTTAAGLVAPGGVLVVVGLARTRSVVDAAYDGVGAVATRVLRRRHGGLAEQRAPVADPTTSYGEVRRAAARLLPGATYRRHVLFRYSLTWTRPA